MAGIYIHIPFCRQACYYCDFHFSTNQSSLPEMVDSICRELEIQKDYLGDANVNTIYFGGGTPSLLNFRQLDKILQIINRLYVLQGPLEVTLEANPDDISGNSLHNWKELGINRLSIGVQSFDDGILKYLNRVHSSSQALESILLARKVGFQNMNVDLIYGILQTDHSRWQSDLGQAVHLKPEHISAYNLTIEENTVFGNWLKKRRIKPVDDDFSAEEFEMMRSTLTSAGYLHYEVSNFCLSGKESRHNSAYWKDQIYLGVGPGAHSYNKETRHYNISNNAGYMRSIKEGVLPGHTETLDLKKKINEYILTSLRTHWGTSLNYLMKEYNFDLKAKYGQYIEDLKKNNLCQVQEDTIILTPDGFLLADRIASDLFI